MSGCLGFPCSGDSLSLPATICYETNVCTPDHIQVVSCISIRVALKNMTLENEKKIGPFYPRRCYPFF